jgi:hypothetical protein
MIQKSAFIRDLRQDPQQVVTAIFITVFVALVMLPVAAMAQTATPVPPTSVPITLDLDLSPVFTSINNYLPAFLGIFGVIGGIAIAIVIAKFVINAIKGAFTGKDI